MKKIKIFSAAWCPYCVKAKEYLEEKGVEFEVIDIDENPDAGQELVELSGQTSIPVIKIDDKVIIGFDKQAIDEALEE